MNADQLAILSLSIRTINDTLRKADLSPGEFEALEQANNDLKKLYDDGGNNQEKKMKKLLQEHIEKFKKDASF